MFVGSAKCLERKSDRNCTIFFFFFDLLEKIVNDNALVGVCVCVCLVFFFHLFTTYARITIQY